MLKNIKLFSTDSDRTTYESSASYETPYVSKVAADNSVHYNKIVQIVEFTFNPSVGSPITLQAEEGMTWGEWINTSYNITNFSISGGYVRDGAFAIGKSDAGSISPVSSDDIIVINGIYTQINGGSSD